MSRALERLGFLAGAECSTMWIRRTYSAYRSVGLLQSAGITSQEGSQRPNSCRSLIVHNSKVAVAAVVPCQSRRTMSILTDLLKRKKKHDDEDDDAIPDAKTLPLIEEAPKALTEEEIDAKRNISRVSWYHRRLINGQHPYPEPMTWIHHTVRYKQKMFGKFGESSGVNPGIMWPTREQLQSKIEYEEICHPLTIQEMVEKKQAERKAHQESIDARFVLN